MHPDLASVLLACQAQNRNQLDAALQWMYGQTKLNSGLQHQITTAAAG
jgi:hypothetical protein